MSRSFTFSSNALRLSWRDWLIVAVLLGAVALGAPHAWRGLERFEPMDDYRTPYHLSTDYWSLSRWSRYAAARYPAVVIGDSFVWGQYAPPEQTLSHYLNRRAGARMVANLGVDGLHPVAMLGLMKHYGRAVSGRGVILHLNALWMSSVERDLQGEEETRFNHPRLAPQITPWLACYDAFLVERLGVVVARQAPFLDLAAHIRLNHFENMAPAEWSMLNPYRNPFRGGAFVAPQPERRPRSNPVPWTRRGIEPVDLPWIDLEESLQWQSFRDLIHLLVARDNDVFVVVGPFNPHLLAPSSLARYRTARGAMESLLVAMETPHLTVSDMPGEYYADASHVLAEGYARIADTLFESRSFREWMGRLRRGSVDARAVPD